MIELIRRGQTSYVNGQTDVKILGKTEYDEETGTKSTVSASRLKSVGKNLFDKNKIIAGGWVKKTDGNVVPDNNWNYTDFIPIAPNANITLSGLPNSQGTNPGWVLFDGNRQYITGGNPGNIPKYSNAKYIRFSVKPSDLDTAQLEYNTTATPYEPYKESTAYITAKDENGKIVELLSYEGIHDEIDIDKGVVTKRLEKDETGLIYQLEELVIIRTEPQRLTIFPNGTRWLEPGNKQTSIYDNGITILDTQTPIQKLYKITKIHIADGRWVRTDVELTKATVASDGLSLTIDGAINGEIYDVEWDYDSSLTTLGELVVSEPTTVTRNNRTITL